MGNCQKITTKEDPIHNTSLKSPKHTTLQLIGKTFTWNRDSHGLFDYENKNIFKNVFKLSHSVYLMRENNEVKMLKSKEDDSPKDKKNDINVLARIIVKDNNYYISSSMIDQQINKKLQEIDGLQANSLWIVVKSLKVNAENRIFKLSHGDYIKLGRIRFRIKEFSNKFDSSLPSNIINNKSSQVISHNNQTMKNNNIKLLDIKTRVSQLLCRICLSDLDEEDNPFITPCKCSGSMQFIHIRCLQQWLKCKLQIKQTYCSISFVWKSFECELCKTTYPDWVEANGIKYDIVEIPRPESPYIILEILSRDKNQCRGIHVLNMGLKSIIKLGRGHDSELRITDISVSRCHAVLKYDKGNFFIEDNASKFGTLVLVKEPLPVSLTNNHLALQVGRTVLYFSVKRTKKVFNAFVKNSIARTETSDGIIEKKEENGFSPMNHGPVSIYDNEDGAGLLPNENNQGVAGNNAGEDVIFDHSDVAPEEEIV